MDCGLRCVSWYPLSDKITNWSKITRKIKITNTNFNWNEDSCVDKSCLNDGIQFISYYKYAMVRTWWRHQMEAFSALLALCAGNPRSPVNSPHKDQWRGVLMFSLICAWRNRWVNAREAGDLRRHRAHYDVTVMRSDWECGIFDGGSLSQLYLPDSPGAPFTDMDLL